MIRCAASSGEIDWWEQPTADLLPVLKKNRAIVTETLDPTGDIGFLRVNSLYPPFDNPAVQRALLGAINQADFMQAVVGADPAMWHVPAGVFTPGTPLATAAGLDAISPEPDYERVKRDLAAAGYRGETVVFIAATDFPVVNALCEVSVDMLRRSGINVDYQALDWRTVTTRRNSWEPPEKRGNADCTYTAGYDLLNQGSDPSLNAIGRAGLVGWPTTPKVVALRSAWFDAQDLAAQQAICAQIQPELVRDPPFLPLGQFFQSAAYRNDVNRILKDASSLLWNIQNQA